MPCKLLFRIFYNGIILLFIVALGFKTAVLFRIILLTIVFMLWMATKLSKKFQTVLCGSLKTYGDSDLFWSYWGNGLVRIPKTAAGLGGPGLKKQLMLGLSKNYILNLFTETVSPAFMDYVIKNIISIHPIIKHSLSYGYCSLRGYSIELYDPAAPRKVRW